MYKEPVMPKWVLILLYVFGGLGWLWATYLLGIVATEDLSKIFASFGWEVAKAAFIAATAGAAFKYFLEGFDRASTDPLHQTEISRVFPSRQTRTAGEIFLEHVRDSRTRHIDLIGISLRDFLIPNGSLVDVWEAIKERVSNEANSNVSEEKKLHVRLLLLDPISGAGRFRAKVESESIESLGLNADVGIAVQEVQKFIESLSGGQETNNYLRIRLYEHSSFSFIFSSDKAVFIEQYTFRNHRGTSRLPLIEYNGRSATYKELSHSFETIWDHARVPELSPNFVGTAKGLSNAGISHIFRVEDKSHLSNRQIESLITAMHSSQEICIQAITGKFYFDGLARPHLDEFLKEGRSTLRAVILHPVSQQAILRAVADSSPLDQIGEMLQQWDWERHTASQLYTDARRIIMGPIAERINLRLTSAMISSSMFLSQNSAFVETYVYGRSKKFQQGNVLGGEHPVFEYSFSNDDDSGTAEGEILKSSFDVLWNFFSIPVQIYPQNVSEEREIFEKNMSLLRILLPSPSVDSGEAMIISTDKD